MGRATFELAREFAHVTGIDFSARFIRVALQLKEKGVSHFALVEEGEVVSYHEARLSDWGLDAAAERVEFCQGDATNLKPQFTDYDLILAANLIDRLSEPRRFLETVHERLNPGGVLVITSPYTWLEEFTHKEHWLGGVRRGGEPYMTLDALARSAEPAFRHARRTTGRGIRHPGDTPEVSTYTRRTDGLGTQTLTPRRSPGPYSRALTAMTIRSSASRSVGRGQPKLSRTKPSP